MVAELRIVAAVLIGPLRLIVRQSCEEITINSVKALYVMVPISNPISCKIYLRLFRRQILNISMGRRTVLDVVP